MLATWPANPRPGARRRLASIMLAAGDPTSALVQWLRLPEAERREGDGLDEVLVKRLRDVDELANENYQVGARLAARCGLERVHAVDDHTADAVHSEEPGFGVAIKRIWSGPNKAVATAQAQPFDNAADMLATYRMSNSVRFQRDSIESDFGVSIKDKTPEYWGRRYVGWWEVRNLRMVANIRAAFAPPARRAGAVGLRIVAQGVFRCLSRHDARSATGRRGGDPSLIRPRHREHRCRGRCVSPSSAPRSAARPAGSAPSTAWASRSSVRPSSGPLPSASSGRR